VTTISAHATMPLERATYHGIFDIRQLPRVVVCAITDESLVDAPEVADVAPEVAPEVADDADDAVPVDFVLLPAATGLVVDDGWSLAAIRPPSARVAATLAAAATRRARAARGVRFPGAGRRSSSVMLVLPLVMG
jgi:hypothetical protein